MLGRSNRNSGNYSWDRIGWDSTGAWKVDPLDSILQPTGGPTEGDKGWPGGAVGGKRERPTILRGLRCLNIGGEYCPPLLFYGRARRIVNERGWEADWRVYAPPTRGKVARAIHPEPAALLF